jgi:predicted metal-dependent phosphoesterase TrpH
MTATRQLIHAVFCCALIATATTFASGVERSKNMHAQTIERRVHLAPPIANESHYAYVAFNVPRRAVRVSISYDYERAGGANTIDIGVFDARSTGSDTDPRGFRGWSGGRRSEFFISRNEATPGYMAGELPTGTWRIILGLYKIAPTGVAVSFKIQVETEDTRATMTALRRADLSSVAPSIKASTLSVTADGVSGTRPLSQKVFGSNLRWWSGDLHMHTVHSDGDWTIPGLISSARDEGLDFICITDHNTASHHAEIDRIEIDRAKTDRTETDRAHRGSRLPLVLRGEEITTYGGHTNAWGLPSGAWIDFRVRAGDAARMSEVAAQAHRYGALISVNHPFVLCGGCAWSYEAALKEFDAVEVWNGEWDATDEAALKMWDEALRRGLRLTAVASSDSHRPRNPIGHPTTHVAAGQLSQTALLAAIRRGRVYLTGEASGPFVSFEAEATTGRFRPRRTVGEEIRLNAPATLRFIINAQVARPGATVSLVSNGTLLRSWPSRSDGQTEVFEVECLRDSYYRLEVRDQTSSMLALTNPIYIKVRARR